MERIAETKALRRLRRKLTEENLWLYVIHVLKEKPMYAYEVKVSIERKFGFKPRTVTVYAVLYRMVREGLLKVDTKNGTKVYMPTEKGIEAFKLGLEFIENTLRRLSASGA